MLLFAVLGFAYLIALSLILLFFAGAAKLDQRWDSSNRAERRKHRTAA